MELRPSNLVATTPEKHKRAPKRSGLTTGAISPATIAEMSDEDLLSQRMCDLDLKIEGTVLEERIETALKELRAHDLDFKPHFWLSD